MINNAVIMGRLVATPELRATQTGKSVISFNVAVDRNYKDGKADFIDCVAWGDTAEFISKYFFKGSMIALTGSLQTRDYEDKNGVKRKITEIVVQNVSFCGSKSETETQSNKIDVKYDDVEEIDFDDVPF